MAASVTFLNSALDGAVIQTTGLYGAFSVALFSGATEASGGGYAKQIISTWNASATGVKQITSRVNFSPSGVNWNYDTVSLYGQTGTLLLHSVAVSPIQTIIAGDTHQILVQLSGS